MSTTIKLTDDARADLQQLPTTTLQQIALQWMSRLRSAPLLGPPLAWRHGQDLRSCRKLSIDEGDTPLATSFTPAKRAADGPRYRIVYRLLPSEDDAQYAQIVGVGRKRDDKGGIYPHVGRRLEDGVEEPGQS